MKDFMNLTERFKKAGIDPKQDRWSAGTHHHPKSLKLVKDLTDIDFKFFNDHFCWKIGGDGDNGETLMYEIDLLMELYDFEKTNKNKQMLMNKLHRHHTKPRFVLKKSNPLA